ncbi:YbaN family protein [Alkalibaculum bacchi]|uniref:YbaN family protein n=1 Tax=Alkalibaculum bacchi TaxID=645887 RepID=UPI0026F14141|nr:YbaN family protein [Alkalibaculum bacchi]
MNGVLRYLLLGIGTLSLGLGIVGMVLPLLPTTPFLLLSAACYYRGSNRAYNYLLHHKIFGKYIDDYRNKGGITLKVKVYALTLLWLSISCCLVFSPIPSYAKVLIFFIASAVTYHIASKKTLRE